MPFVSEAQRRHFIENRAELEKQGVNVDEWVKSSEGLKLPERAPERASGPKFKAFKWHSAK